MSAKKTKKTSPKRARPRGRRRVQLDTLSAKADLLLGSHGFVPIAWENAAGDIIEIVEDSRGGLGFERTPRCGPSQLRLTLGMVAKIVVSPRTKRRGRAAIVPLPKGAKQTNNGVECDAYDGPCACGAWHHGRIEQGSTKERSAS